MCVIYTYTPLTIHLSTRSTFTHHLTRVLLKRCWNDCFKISIIQNPEFMLNPMQIQFSTRKNGSIPPWFFTTTLRRIRIGHCSAQTKPMMTTLARVWWISGERSWAWTKHEGWRDHPNQHQLWLPSFIVSLKGEVPLQRNLVPQTPRGATLTAFPIEVIYHSPSSTLSSIFVEDFEKLYTKLEREGRGRKTVKAQHLWFRILEAQMETGTPYMLYKDLLEAAVLEKPCGQRVGIGINNRNGIIYVIHWWFSLFSQRSFLLHVHCGLVACSKNSRLSVVGSRQPQVQSTELGHDPLLQPLHWDHWIHLSRWGENGGCGIFLRETFQNFCPPVHPLFRKCIPSDSEALQVAVCNLASIASWANQKIRFLERKSSKKCTDISGSWLVNYHNPHIDINLGANATWLLKMHNVWPGIWSTESSACFQVANTHVWYWGYSPGCMAKILQNPDQIWYKKVKFWSFSSTAHQPRPYPPSWWRETLIFNGCMRWQRWWPATSTRQFRWSRRGALSFGFFVFWGTSLWVWNPYYYIDMFFFWAFGRIVEVGSGILVLYRSILVSYLAFSLEAHHRVRRFADRSLIEIIIQWYLGSQKIGQDWIHGGFVIRTWCAKPENLCGIVMETWKNIKTRSRVLTSFFF